MPADGILPPGTKLRGTYVIENMIGEGGMGVVYACMHETLRKRCAIKVLEPKYARLQTTRQRFLSEGRIQANLAHPHIVKVIDVIDGEKEGGLGGILAIVMEHVQGDSMDHIIKQRGQLSEYDAVSSTLVTLDAIGYAHHTKIIHRDLKPSNIMVCEKDASESLYNGIKVMDFGIAKLLEDKQNLTVTGCQMGTPLYMPPEQIENPSAIDERADLYALGITLYEMLCGRTPFAEYREFELMRAQVSMKPPSMKNFRRDISDRLEAIVMKALEKNRENRYPNAEAFQRDLLSLGGYDDIQLLLNPNEGTTLQPTNKRLQRKIERAIADASETASNKNQKASKAKDVVDAVKNAVVQKSDVVDPIDNTLDQPDLEKAVQAPQTSAQPAASDAKQAPAPKASTQSNLINAEQLNSDSNANEPKAKKQTRADDDLTEAKAPAKRTRAPKTEATDDAPAKRTRTPKTEATDDAPAKRTRAPKTEAADDAPAKQSRKNTQAVDVENAPTQSKSRRKNNAATETNAQNSASDSKKRSQTRTNVNSDANSDKRAQKTPHVAPQPARTQTANAIPAPSDSRSHRIKLAFALVALILLILATTGIVYRTNNNMPQATAPAPKQDLSEEAPQPIQNIAEAPLKEIATPFGYMSQIPAGRHFVSASKPDELKPIELSAFYIDQTEVSHYEYAKCVAAEKCPPLSYEVDSKLLPVTNIGLKSAEAFCKFAGKQLPSAEQWEAAARYGNQTNGITFVNVSCDTVVYAASADCKGKLPARPQNVYSHANGSNPAHLRNMLGNVREWVTTPDSALKNVQTKGGSFQSPASAISIGANILQPPNQGSPDLGFRCIKE